MLLSLTGKDPSVPPSDCLPMYHREDGEKIAAAISVFNKPGLVLMGPSPLAASLVDLSSRDPSSKATEEEEGEGESSAPRQRDLLHNFSDNDEEDTHPVVEPACYAGFTTRSGVASLKQPKQASGRRGRSKLIPPGNTPPSPSPSHAAPTACSPSPKSAAQAAPAKPPLMSLKRSYVASDQ